MSYRAYRGDPTIIRAGVMRSRVHLEIGEVHIAHTPAQLWTVLGSCVAVIIFAPQAKISAICHAQLPSPSRSLFQCVDTCPHPCMRQVPQDLKVKYVTCSIEYMLSELARVGLEPQRMVATILGGSNVLGTTHPTRAIGTQNVDAARRVLALRRFRRVVEDVGGVRGRTINYLSDTGDIDIRYHRENAVTCESTRHAGGPVLECRITRSQSDADPPFPSSRRRLSLVPPASGIRVREKTK